MAADPKVEPSAAVRSAAVQMFGMFNALVQAGFSESQAIRLVAEMLRATIQKPTEEGDR